MRLAPAQVGMMLLLGGRFRPFGEQTIKERIAKGHRYLVAITREDLGFDPQRWHEYLRGTGAGGYRSGVGYLNVPKGIARALDNPEWLAAIAELQRGE